MTLRTRLALSHLFVVGLFAAIFITVVLIINGAGPSPRAIGQRDHILREVEGATSRAN